MHIKQETSRTEALLEIVRVGMRRHTESQVPWEDCRELTFVASDDDGKVRGAALGETGRGWLHVSVVWVDESARGSGIGNELVAALEASAIECGCHSAYLDTFSYQARPFYESLGYEVFGCLEDYPPGHQRYYMRKKLIVT